MLEIVRIAGVSILGVLGALILKDRNKGAAFVCSVCAFLTVVILCFKGSLGNAASEMINICSGSAIYEYTTVLMRAVGISYIASMTGTLCKEAGEPMIGGAVELFAKGELIALSLPLVRELMSLAGELLGQ